MALLLVIAACTGGHKQAAPPATEPGGTLRVGSTVANNPWDPQHQATWLFDEIQRCCLARTLLSYRAGSAGQGGTTLRPDLATALPAISSDGLTWTFHLKSGIHYAPPLQRVEVQAQDFVTAMLRDLSPSPPYLAPPTLGGRTDTFEDLIVGAREYAEGHATTVSGIQAPDRQTLRVHLTRPAGELGYVFASPDLLPIPPKPGDPGARFGVATGHESDYGYFQAASGPYMIQGADRIDFALPAVRQSMPSGITPQSITLVRNLSWDRATDPLRRASVDRIVLTQVSSDHAAREVEKGRVDFVMEPWDMPESVWQRYRSTPSLRGRAFVAPGDFQRYLSLNLALPPLDDVHVRRAINYVVDKAALLKVVERQVERSATVATHIALDSEEENLLVNYDPYHSPGDTGDVAMAKAEMAKSKYDGNHDGICDAAVCAGIRMLIRESDPVRVAAAPLIRASLRKIGLGIRLDPEDDEEWIAESNDHPGPSKIPIDFVGFTKGLPTASSSLEFFGSDHAAENVSLVGATSAELRQWRYPVTNVPNVDDRIRQCRGLAFEAQVKCWAGFDQYLMADVVPWVPLWSEETGRITSDRVASFSFDQATVVPKPALDQITLTPATRRERSPSPSPVASSPAIGAPIPEGTYSFTLTPRDAARFGLSSDDAWGNTGTFTLTLAAGHWRSTQVSDSASWTVSSGFYYGSGSTVTFVTQLPPANALELSPVGWALDGRSLRFTLTECTGPARSDRTLCGLEKMMFTAHPWIGEGA